MKALDIMKHNRVHTYTIKSFKIRQSVFLWILLHICLILCFTVFEHFLGLLVGKGPIEVLSVLGIRNHRQAGH